MRKGVILEQMVGVWTGRLNHKERFSAVSYGVKEETMTNRDPNDKKLKELILYIALRSEGDDFFGATKLNKLLFYSDFLAYLNFGQAITWQEYQKLPLGPAPRRLLPIQREMEAAGDIVIVPREFFGYPQHKIIARRNEADLSIFTPQEIDIVNRLILRYWNKNASEISEESHHFSGWKHAEIGETIPYEVVLVGVRDFTPEEFEYAETLEPIAAGLLSG